MNSSLNSLSNIGFLERNHAIDLFRAVTMLFMIFVNDLWSISEVPHWLEHAASTEDMLGFSDVVFPCFLVVLGMSIPFAIERRFDKGFSGESTIGHVLSRTFALLILGAFTVNTEYAMAEDTRLTKPVFRILMVIGFFLVWNVYPKPATASKGRLVQVLNVCGMLLLVVLAVLYRGADGTPFGIRWWGILGLIGWTYLFCSMVYIFARKHWRYLLLVGILCVCWTILRTPLRDGEAILALPAHNFVDQFLQIIQFGNGCLPAFTMSGVVMVMLHTKYKSELSPQKLVLWGLLGVIAFLVLGVLTRQYWIVSKIQGTPPWLFFCVGIALLQYVIFSMLSAFGYTRWFRFIQAVGTATLTCYILPYVLYSVFTMIDFSTPAFLQEGAMGLLKCFVFALLTIKIAEWIGLIGVKLKI